MKLISRSIISASIVFFALASSAMAAGGLEGSIGATVSEGYDMVFAWVPWLAGLGFLGVLVLALFRVVPAMAAGGILVVCVIAGNIPLILSFAGLDMG